MSARTSPHNKYDLGINETWRYDQSHNKLEKVPETPKDSDQTTSVSVEGGP